MTFVNGVHRQKHHRARVRRCLGGIVMLILSISPAAHARDELALKAAIVFNLLQFVQWPVSNAVEPDDPLVLCAQRDASMWWHLRALEDRALPAGRPLRVRALGANRSDNAPCHASFIEAMVKPGAEYPLLVIADVDVPEAVSSVVRLRRAGDRVGFEVDLARARRAGLQISSKLLRLASRVQE